MFKIQVFSHIEGVQTQVQKCTFYSVICILLPLKRVAVLYQFFHASRLVAKKPWFLFQPKLIPKPLHIVSRGLNMIKSPTFSQTQGVQHQATKLPLQSYLI